MRRIFDYWSEFYEEFRVWRRYRKAARQNEEILVKNNMRVDWLGRIYTVVNMPEEVINNQEQVQQGWVISQLGPMNEMLLKIGIADYAYPDISLVPETQSYLIVMYPEIDHLNVFRIILNLLALTIIGFTLYALFILTAKSGLFEWAKQTIGNVGIFNK
tara:strand:+ start:612 stop:1088 length:477 start_codon:yes stop_codon:yes gene_type:complete